MKADIKRHRSLNKLRAALLSIAIVGASGPMLASCGEPIQRLGRNFGVGWGDGYHACASSGLRIHADLPPRSFAATHRPGGHQHPLFTGMGHHAGTTFYDRFDAGNGGCCDSGCDASRCDGAPQMVIHGSQVLRGRNLPANQPANESPYPTPAPTSSLAQTVPVPNSAIPNSANSVPVPNSPSNSPHSLALEGSEVAAFAGNARSFLPEKQYPLSMQAPSAMSPPTFDLQPVDAADKTALVMPGYTAASEPAPGDAENPPAHDAGSTRPVMVQAVPSATPALIYPAHQQDAPSRQTEMLASPPVTEAFAVNSGQRGSLQAPSPTDAVVDAQADSYSLHRTQKVTSDETSQVARSEAIATPLAGAAQLGVTVPRQSSLAPPSLASQSFERPAPMRLASTTSSADGNATDPRPHRLGSTTGTSGVTATRSQTRSTDGIDPGFVRVNPFASRPTVELAKRPSGSSQGVIYQPSPNGASSR